MEKFRCALARAFVPRKSVIATLVALAVVMVLPLRPAASFTLDSPGSDAPAPTQFTPRYAVLPMKGGENFDASRLPLGTTTVPMWTGSASYSGKNYSYTMVGKNPATPGTLSTTIKGVVVPIKFTFTSYSNAVFDPTAVDPVCSPTASALTRFKGSPLVKSISGLKIGGTKIGTGEYTDLFQRANFWNDTQPGGVSPNYHTKVGWTYHSVVDINVSGGQIYSASCSGGNLGAMDIDTWDAYVQTTLIPSLHLTPNEFPFFLFYDVVMYENGNPSECCVIGYHSAENTAGGVQTYGVGDYDASGDFTGLSDIAALSHEVAEWMDDPLTNNPTPAWGHIGQVSGCQANLEVGDPLSGTIEPITLSGFTYHVQDLAFVSWFFRQSPSKGVNGQYSLYNNLSPQPVCS